MVADSEVVQKAPASVVPFRQPLIDLLDADPDADAAELSAKFAQARISRLQFLIVTLPDPLDSSLGYTFDEALNTLQSAVGTQDFLIDQFYLPWHKAQMSSEHQADPDYHRDPGVIVFRRRGTEPVPVTDEDKKRSATDPGKRREATELLVMYLVGETPVAGIHQRVFDRTIAEIEFLSQAHSQSLSKSDPDKPVATVKPGATDKPTIHIVGSTFSGSADSLARSMGRAQQFQFDVISGSASNVSPSRIRELSDGTLKSFASVRIPARLAFLAAVRFLDESRQSSDPLRIAWLHEANTSFGSWLTQFSGDTANQDGLSLQMTTFPFPLHLSHVRTLIDRKSQNSAANTPGQKTSLHLHFEHDYEPRDAVPQMAPGMTNPTTELVLSRILATIKEQGFKYVGITATDTQDRVFLCQRMREFCPDVQVVLDFSDRIFTHPTYRSFMKGALVTSTYPMYVENQKWSYPYLAAGRRVAPGEGKRFQVYRQLAMSNELMPGLFNATVLSLENAMPGRYAKTELPLIDFGEPFIDALKRHSTLPEKTKRGYVPPLWISVVGNGTIQPLTYWTIQDLVKYERSNLPGLAPATESSTQQEVNQPAGVLPIVKLNVPVNPVVLELDYTMSGRAYLVWLLGVAAVMTWMLGRSRYDPTVLRPDPARLFDSDERQTVRGLLWGLLDRRVDPLLRRRQTTWLIALVLPSWLLLTYCTVAGLVPLLTDAAQAQSGRSVLYFVLLMIGAAAGAPALILEIRRRRGMERKPGTSVGVGLMGVVVLIVVAACAASLFFASARYLSHAVQGLELVIGTWLASQLCGLLVDMREDARAVHSRIPGEHPPLPVPTAFTGRATTLHVWTLAAGGVLHLLTIATFAGLLDISLCQPSLLTGKHILWFERTFRVTSGVSWIIPASLVIAAILFWVLSRLNRLFLLDRSRPFPPWPCIGECPIQTTGLGEALRSLNRTQQSIEDILLDPAQALRSVAGATVAGVFLLTIVVLTLIAQEATSCFEGAGHTLVLWGALCFLIVIWVYWMWELGWMIWLLRQLLRQIAWLPMTAAFLRVPERIRAVLGRFLVVRSPHQSHLRIRVQYLQELVDGARDYQAELSTGKWTMFQPSEFASIDSQFSQDLKELRSLEDQGGATMPTMTRTIEQLNLAGFQIWNGLLEDWTTRSVLENYPVSVETEFRKTGGETGFEGWKNRAEELMAIQIRAYITGYAAQLKHLLITAMFSTLLFLMAVVSYPMQPSSLLTSVAMIMVTTVSLIATWAVVQFDRDEFLRRIQGADAAGNQYGLQFWFRTLTWLAPAIMVLVSAVFPNGWDWVYMVLEPVLSATN